jgi:hypothetical protein
MCQMDLARVVKEEKCYLPCQVQISFMIHFTLHEPIVVKVVSHEKYPTFTYM